jgi:transposase InsO family protein
VVRVMEKMRVSERRACGVLGQARSTQRRRPKVRDDEDTLTKRIIELATCYGRYGYRRITAMLCREGWPVNHKRVERIWRQEGLKVPKKQPRSSPSGEGCGSLTAPVSGFGPAIETTYGVTTLSTTAQVMGVGSRS